MAEGLAWSVPGTTGRNLTIYDRTVPKSEETFLATARSLVRQMTGAEPPGLKEGEMDKWLKYKVKWDTDLSSAGKFLSADQVKQAEDWKTKKRASVVNEAAFTPERKRYQSDKSYNDSLWSIEAAKVNLKQMDLSHEDAQKLLYAHAKGKQTTAYWDRVVSLGGLYGQTEAETRDEVQGKKVKGNRAKSPDTAIEIWKKARLMNDHTNFWDDNFSFEFGHACPQCNTETDSTKYPITFDVTVDDWVMAGVVSLNPRTV